MMFEIFHNHKIKKKKKQIYFYYRLKNTKEKGGSTRCKTLKMSK